MHLKGVAPKSHVANRTAVREGIMGIRPSSGSEQEW